jgi:pyruvate dehydrogenase E1 component alpha subunit
MNKEKLYLALKNIIKIRQSELNISKDFEKNKIFSFLHLCIGQEAVAVGTAMALTKKDYFFGNHRSHGHYLAKGGNFKKMIFEIYGDKRGCCQGLGGSMHMLDLKKGFVGSSPILGSGPPIATGIAFAKKLRKEKNICVVFLGDGASEEGAFYESLNLSGLLKLPLLFVIENNLYAGETSAEHRKTKGFNINLLVRKGFNLLFKEVNGQDFCEVYQNIFLLKKQILKLKKPGVLYANCLRRYAHSGIYSDLKSDYRKDDKEITHLKYDPIKILTNKLAKIGEKKDKIIKFINYHSLKEDKKFSEVRNKIKVRNIQ